MRIRVVRHFLVRVRVRTRVSFFVGPVGFLSVHFLSSSFWWFWERACGHGVRGESNVPSWCLRVVTRECFSSWCSSCSFFVIFVFHFGLIPFGLIPFGLGSLWASRCFGVLWCSSCTSPWCSGFVSLSFRGVFIVISWTLFRPWFLSSGIARTALRSCFRSWILGIRHGGWCIRVSVRLVRKKESRGGRRLVRSCGCQAGESERLEPRNVKIRREQVPCRSAQRTHGKEESCLYHATPARIHRRRGDDAPAGDGGDEKSQGCENVCRLTEVGDTQRHAQPRV